MYKPKKSTWSNTLHKIKVYAQNTLQKVKYLQVVFHNIRFINYKHFIKGTNKPSVHSSFKRDHFCNKHHATWFFKFIFAECTLRIICSTLNLSSMVLWFPKHKTSLNNSPTNSLLSTYFWSRLIEELFGGRKWALSHFLAYRQPWL